MIKAMELLIHYLKGYPSRRVSVASLQARRQTLIEVHNGYQAVRNREFGKVSPTAYFYLKAHLEGRRPQSKMTIEFEDILRGDNLIRAIRAIEKVHPTYPFQPRPMLLEPLPDPLENIYRIYVYLGDRLNVAEVNRLNRMMGICKELRYRTKDWDSVARIVLTHRPKAPHWHEHVYPQLPPEMARKVATVAKWARENTAWLSDYPPAGYKVVAHGDVRFKVLQFPFIDILVDWEHF